MKITLKLEFPDEQAADVFRWLQKLPAGCTVRSKPRKSKPLAALTTDYQPKTPPRPDAGKLD